MNVRFYHPDGSIDFEAPLKDGAQLPRIGEAMEVTQFGSQSHDLGAFFVKNVTHRLLVPDGIQWSGGLAGATVELETQEELVERARRRLV